MIVKPINRAHRLRNQLSADLLASFGVENSTFARALTRCRVWGNPLQDSSARRLARRSITDCLHEIRRHRPSLFNSGFSGLRCSSISAQFCMGLA